MKRVFGTVLSIGLHAIVASILLYEYNASKAPAHVPEVALVDIVQDSMHPISYSERTVAGHTDGLSSECPRGKVSYTGVGMLYDANTGTVDAAPENMPAYIAGIRINDIFLNPFDSPDADGYIDIKIERYNTVLTFHVKTTRICYDKK